MNNRYGDNRYGSGRDRMQSPRYGERGGFDSGRDDDRGFLERAGDELRSWFGDDEADRRREADERGMERERGYGSDDANNAYAGPHGTAGGWGNQPGNSWSRERPGAPGSYGAYGGRDSGFDNREGGYGRERDRGQDRYGRQAPRYGAYGGGMAGGRSSGSGYDPLYSEWRNREIETLDRDYEDFRREHQSKFEEDFRSWRSRRGEQRQSLGRVSEHMEVIGSDGEKIGTVDKIAGDRIILARKDENAGGIHHSIPCGWIESVDEKVTVNRSSEQAMREWRDEERSRGLFEPEDSGSEGPHILNRSFSGTY